MRRSKKPVRWAKLTLALAIYKACRRRPRSRAELAEQFGVSEQTIRRILLGLQAARVRMRMTRRGRQRHDPLQFRVLGVGR